MMKKELYIARPGRLYSTAVLTSMLLFCSITDANAMVNKQDPTDKVQISYIGLTNDLMTFNVNFNNIRGENFVLELTGDHGEVLYQKTYNDTTFNKNICLKSAGEKCRVNFTVSACKHTFTQRFEIESQTRLVNEMIVSKI